MRLNTKFLIIMAIIILVLIGVSVFFYLNYQSDKSTQPVVTEAEQIYNFEKNFKQTLQEKQEQQIQKYENIYTETQSSDEFESVNLLEGMASSHWFSLNDSKQGYYIKDDYIYYEGEKVIDKKLGQIFDDGARQYIYNIWNVIDLGKYTHIYLTISGECMACGSFMSQYLVIDNNNSEFAVKDFENLKLKLFSFDPYMENRLVISPDRTKVAVVLNNRSIDIDEDTQESYQEEIWVVDLLNQEEQFHEFVEPGKTVMNLCWDEFQTYYIVDDRIKWSADSNSLILTPTEPLNITNYTNGNAARIEFVNFQGDNVWEAVIFYKAYENVGENEYRNNEHLKVIAYIDDDWTMVKHDVVSSDADQVTVEGYFSIAKVVDFGNDGKKELIASKCKGRFCESKYYVFAYENGSFHDLAIAKGYLHSEEYLKDGETFIYLERIELSPLGIMEGYDVYCEDKDWGMAEFGTDRAVCRSFNLWQEYKSGTFYPELITR